MEAAAAFGLAANVLGVVSFCLDLHAIYSDVRKKGTSVSIDECRLIAERLKDDCASIEAAKAHLQKTELTTEDVSISPLQPHGPVFPFPLRFGSAPVDR